MSLVCGVGSTCGGVDLLDAGAHGVDKAAGGEGASRLAEGSPALAHLSIGHACQWDQCVFLELLLHQPMPVRILHSRT